MPSIPIPFFGPLMWPTKFVKAGVFLAGANPHYSSAGYNAVMLRGSGAVWSKGTTISDAYPVSIIVCGAYGAAVGPDNTPTFIAGGSVYDPDSGQERGLIVTSTNGTDWTQTHRGPEAEVYAMGWDETKRRFYAQAWTAPDVNDENDNGFIRVLQSTDGHTWSSDEVHNLTADDPQEAWASPQLQGTGTPLVKDDEGNVVPNGGLFGWDRSANIMISPTTLAATEIYLWFQVSKDKGPSGSVEVIRQTGDGVSRTTVAVPMDHVLCVGHANGLWQAGGYNGKYSSLSIAVSADNGATWKPAYTDDNLTAAFCMMAS